MMESRPDHQIQVPTEVPGIAPRHLRDLYGRGISAATVIAAGITSYDAASISRHVYGARSGRSLPADGFRIPYLDLEGNPVLDESGVPVARFRMDTDNSSRHPKYLGRLGASHALYIPPGLLRAIKDTLLVTEGELKSLKATQDGFPTVGLAGVWQWSDPSKRPHDPDDRLPVGPDTPILPELAELCKDRRVIVIADSDGATNRQVRKAMETLARAIQAQTEAEGVSFVILPAGPNGAKVGIDDLLCLEDGRNRLERVLDGARPVGETYGLKVDPQRYSLGPDGVLKMQYQKGVGFQPDYSKPIASRPIFPELRGQDIGTGATYYKLAWADSVGNMRSAWLPDHATNSQETLLALDDAPISLGRIRALSDFLADAKGYIASPAVKISTKTGWVGLGTDRRFVLSGDPVVECIGKGVERAGTLDGYSEGLSILAALGEPGFTALAVAGLCAAGPASRLVRKRNPVLGLVAESSLGKGTAASFGLAIWGHPSQLTVPAGSTVKGLQDLSIGSPDLPIFADALQQLLKVEPRRVEDLLYYLANGQRRVTSSKAQEAVGGERRYGIGLYAAEESVSHALQFGAQFRVIELARAPMPSEACATQIQGITRSHYGVVGPLLAEAFTVDQASISERIEAIARKLRADHPGLKGDDPYSIAFVGFGLESLARATKVNLPVSEVPAWLAKCVAAQRSEAVDRYLAAWQALLDTIMGVCGEFGTVGVTIQGGTYLAWRGEEAPNSSGGLEINPKAPMVEGALRPFGGGNACARVWGNRGWIERQGTDWKVKRRQSGKELRVWRITAEGMAAAGYSPCPPTIRSSEAPVIIGF